MTTTDQTVPHPGLVLGTASSPASRVLSTTTGAVGAGLVLGVGWGIAARVWMRLVATLPAFSWSGTLFILGLSGLAGASLGLVHAARVRGRSRWWRLSALPTLALFAGPGMPFLPAYLLGGWAWSSRRVPAAFRALVVLPLVGLPFYGWALEDWRVHQLVSPYAAIGGFLALEAALAAAGSVLFRPWPKRTGGTGGTDGTGRTTGTDPAVP